MTNVEKTKILPNILIVSNNPFSETSNNGKTLASFFLDYPKEKIAQLYLSDELPDDLGFNSFYRIYDGEIFRAKFRGSNPGGAIQTFKTTKKSSLKVRRTSSILSRLAKSNAIRLVREWIWSDNIWCTEDLINWIDAFKPDVVFFCAGDAGFAYRINQFVTNRYRAKSVVYLTDDYILPRKTVSLFWWLRRNFVLDRMKNAVRSADLFITISTEMQHKYKEIFGVSSMVAMNYSESMLIEDFELNKNRKNNCLEFVYAGGLHSNRFKTLASLANAVSKVNLANALDIKLIIYTGTRLRKQIVRKLEKSGVCEFGGMLNARRLKVALNEADVLVHVEAFDKKSIESTRLSISTKIPEYLSLGKPILAIGPAQLSSMKFLEGVAYCINSLTKIGTGIDELVWDGSLRENLASLSLQKYNDLLLTKNRGNIVKEIMVLMNEHIYTNGLT